MKLGFLSVCLANRSFEECVLWGAENGFDTIEIACWPKEYEKRRYAGVTHIDVDRLDVKKTRDILEASGISISALAYYPNYLDPDKSKRAFYIDHLKKTIIAASNLGVGIVGTFVGRDKDRDDDYNLALYKDIFTDIVRLAEKHNVKIAIENCPMLWSDRWPGGHNIARSPEIWGRMFDLIQSDHIGLNFDPSHLVWQFIDYVGAIYSFKEKIFHTHAKDTRIIFENLAQKGIYGFGFYEDKIAGTGDIDWKRYFGALYDIGYEGAVSIEHEDRNWEKDEEAVKGGVLLAKKLISFYMP
jgi:sugar phosphate isomerase/epimerase